MRKWLCSAFGWHSFKESLNAVSDRWIEEWSGQLAPTTQRRFKRTCVHCGKTQFQRIDMTGNEWWENKATKSVESGG